VKKYCLKGLTVICQRQQIRVRTRYNARISIHWNTSLSFIRFCSCFRFQSGSQSQYILDALIQGLDEYQTQHTDVTLEALRGLISLIPHLSVDQFEKHYTAVIYRIKQFFENVRKPSTAFARVFCTNCLSLFPRKTAKCVTRPYGCTANCAPGRKSSALSSTCPFTITFW